MADKPKNDPLFSSAEEYFNDAERDLAKLEPGWAKAALCFRTNEHFGHGVSERRLQGLSRIYEQLEVYRRRFEGGDTLALLQAISNCAQENLPLPTWLAHAYIAALANFQSISGPLSLDDVFKSPVLPTNTTNKKEDAIRDWETGALLWRDMWMLVHRDQKISSFNAALKATLSAKKYGVKESKARELVLMVEKSQLQFLGKTQTLSRFLEIRQKAFQGE